MSGAESPAGFGIYVHWPFCRSRCPYCDFNAHVARTLDQETFRTALLADLDHAAALQEVRLPVSSVFFGGGTPSLMAPATVAAVLARVARHWPLAAQVEVTLEANPTSAERGRLADFCAAGVSRLSLGVQALDDGALGFLGRRHTAAEALAAVRAGRSLFAGLSLDLIYARPGQSAGGWRAELACALDEGADHLALYQLTMEPGTPFERLWRRGALVLPDADAAADLYGLTQQLCADASLPAYEISNHARAGAQCRHNLIYWRAGDYAGVGPGAHGRLRCAPGRTASSACAQPRRCATRAVRAPGAWAAQVRRRGHGLEAVVALDAQAQAEEMMLMGLRLREGVAAARYAALAGAQLNPARLAWLCAAGLLWRRGGRLGATAPGRLVLNRVLAELLA